MGLVIKAEGENLVVSQGTNTLTLKLTSVVSMQLTDYMASAEEIESHSDGPTEVYTLEGIKVGEFETIDKARASLQPGLYILKDKSGRTIKIYIEQ